MDSTITTRENDNTITTIENGQTDKFAIQSNQIDNTDDQTEWTTL